MFNPATNNAAAATALSQMRDEGGEGVFSNWKMSGTAFGIFALRSEHEFHAEREVPFLGTIRQNS